MALEILETFQGIIDGNESIEITFLIILTQLFSMILT